MADTIEISITSQDVLSLRQSCQIIITEFKRYVGSVIATDENAIYPLMLEQVKGLRVDVEAGKNTLDSFDRLTINDIQRPSNVFGELSSFKDIEKIEGNYTISQSIYDEAQTDIKNLFDGLKHRESPRTEETQGSGFRKDNQVTKTSTEYDNKNYSQSLPMPKEEKINSGSTVESTRKLVDGSEELSAGAQTASYKTKAKGKFLNTLREECIPCDLRLDSLDGLKPSIELLSILEDLKNKYKELVNKIKNLLNNTEIADDICSLLNFLDFQCLPDLFGIIILLSSLINKYRDAFLLNPDGAFLQFIGPFFSPLLNGLTELLDKYMQMIMRPIDCILNALDTQLTKLDVQRAVNTAEVQNIGYHRKREGYLRRKIDDLKERRAYLEGLVNAGEDGGSAPKRRIGGQPRSSQSNPLRNLIETDPSTPRGAFKETSLFGTISINEELEKLNDQISKVQEDYGSEYGNNGKNNIEDLTKKSQIPSSNVIGNARGALRDARQGLNSSLYELRGQILNGRRMINDTLKVMRDELQRLIAGRAATSEEMLEGARNIQRLARLIGIVNTLIKLANKGKLCENSNSDPSVALGSFLTANKGTEQNNNYYNVYIGDNTDGVQSLLIAPSDAVLELADPETDTITQIDNLDEINKLNSDGIPKNLGDITDKKVTATVTDLGFQAQVSVIEFDLCKNSNLSTANNVNDIKNWAVNAGFSI